MRAVSWVLTGAFLWCSALAGLHGCSGSNKKAAGQDCSPPPQWLTAPGKHCAIGSSGPTLKPDLSLYQAENDARVALVSTVTGVDVKSGLTYGETTRIVDFTLVDSTLPGLATQGFWADHCGEGPLRTTDVVYVLACVESRGTDCAFGVSGPTLDPDDARTNAEENAKLRIAEARSVRVQSATLIDTEQGVSIYQGSQATVPVPENVKCREVNDAGGTLPREGYLSVICCAQ